MLKIMIPIFALLLGYALLVIGNGLLGTLLAVRMAHEAFSTEVIGLVQSANYLGFILGTLACGRIIDRVGHIRAFSALAAIAASTALGHALIADPLIWALLRIATGFCLVGLFMATESWLNATATNNIRGQVFSLYMITSYLGLGSGQFLLNLGDINGFQLFSLVAILFCLSLVPVTLTRSQGPAPLGETLPGFGLRQLYRISPLGVGGCLAAGLLSSSFFAMAPLFAAGIGLTITHISGFMGLTILSGLLLQWPVGRLSDRYDRRLVILILAILAAAISMAIIVIGDRSPERLLVLVCAYAGLTFTLYGLSVAHANDLIDQEHRVSASAGLLLAFALGASLGPILSSMLMGRIGPAGLFVFFAGVVSLLALFTLYRMIQRSPVPAEEKGAFVAIPATTPVLAALDPRTEPPQGELDFSTAGGQQEQESGNQLDVSLPGDTCTPTTRTLSV